VTIISTEQTVVHHSNHHGCRLPVHDTLRLIILSVILIGLQY